MLFSICIPTYKREVHLNNCLNSILISSKKVKDFNFEVCISDNNSDYDVEKLVKNYQNLLNIKLIKNKKNLGFSLNAIQAVNMASGKFAWLIGNDDLLLGGEGPQKSKNQGSGNTIISHSNKDCLIGSTKTNVIRSNIRKKTQNKDMKFSRGLKIHDAACLNALPPSSENIKE